jgi:probable HAF family extracellular repeat protein
MFLNRLALKACATWALLTLGVPAASAQRPWVAVDLGTLGGADSVATDINEPGQVVGWSRTASSPSRQRAFLWTRDDGMKDLGSLGADSSAAAINDAGKVVGSSLTTPTGAVTHAFLWTAAQGMKDLGTLGGTASTATDINNAGQVVGWSHGPSTYRRAFLWTETAGMVSLGTPGGNHSEAHGVNEYGAVVGWSEISPFGPRHAFMWTVSGGMIDLGVLNGTHSPRYQRVRIRRRRE